MKNEERKQLIEQLRKEYPAIAPVAFLKYEKATPPNVGAIVVMQVKNIGRCKFLTISETYTVKEILTYLRMDVFNKLMWLGNELAKLRNTFAGTGGKKP